MIKFIWFIQKYINTAKREVVLFELSQAALEDEIEKEAEKEIEKRLKKENWRKLYI
jgi:hypothetical protein